MDQQSERLRRAGKAVFEYLIDESLRLPKPPLPRPSPRTTLEASPSLILRGMSRPRFAALHLATETLALELQGKNIQVNALGPGSIHTQMWEELRDGGQAIGDADLYALGQRVTSGGGASIEQAAALAVFLGSEASGTLSGRLISAVTDDVPHLPAQIERIMASDAFTLRRVELR
jgi:hypothetical protein